MIHKRSSGKPDRMMEKLRIEENAAFYAQEIEAAGGSKTWTQGTTLYWETEIQEKLKLAGFEITEQPRQEDQAVMINDKIKIIPASITIKSQVFLKKESIKNKMKQEFNK